MEICKCHIIISKIIHCLTHKLISKKRRIAFYIGVDVFFPKEIHNDVLNLLWRTSMHGRKCNGITDFGWNSLDILSGHMFKESDMLKKPCPAFSKNLCITGILHSLNKIINLLILDSFKIVSTGHIELESVRASKSEFFGDHMKCHPSLDILFHRLWNIKLCGPFAVICLIFCHDTWLRNTCGELRSIHLLYRL